MPTTIHRGALANLSPLGLSLPPSYRPDDVLIGPWSRNAIGHELTGMGASNFASAVWPAQGAIGYPFELTDSFLAQKAWRANGATVGTNQTWVQVWPEGGSNGGSDTPQFGAAATTLVANANAMQEFDYTDALLIPGRYLCVMGQNGLTATALRSAPAAALLRAAGCTFDGGAGLGQFFPLNGTMPAYMPLFGIAGRTQVE